MPLLTSRTVSNASFIETRIFLKGLSFKKVRMKKSEKHEYIQETSQAKMDPGGADGNKANQSLD